MLLVITIVTRFWCHVLPGRGVGHLNRYRGTSRQGYCNLSWLARCKLIGWVAPHVVASVDRAYETVLSANTFGSFRALRNVQDRWANQGSIFALALQFQSRV